jgi:cellulose synthase (UDP-forming)
MSVIGTGRARLFFSRAIGVVTAAAGLYYIAWRYAASLNTAALWFALPMVLAETYGIAQMLLFVLGTWKQPLREAPPPPASADVDVFITTYNEPVELVRMTAEAATRIDWPDKKVYVLDDGSRDSMRRMAEELGCGYICRGAEWAHKPRHAKAGNVNNALLETSGEFILILDADQIPAPGILERTLGYFADEKIAFVQTPQYFYNLPPEDPFGNDAMLFYGPIQQGKDGWNAAFFCGSNAVLRRESLMQLGIKEYIAEMEGREKTTIDLLMRQLRGANCAEDSSCAAIDLLMRELKAAREALGRGEPLERVSDMVNEAVSRAEVLVSTKDMEAIAADMKELAERGDLEAASVYRRIAANVDGAARSVAPLSLESLGLAEASLGRLDLTRADEALPIQALATISITEDMATAMRLHALGWKSVFHPETLAYGLAPEDLGTSLKQRLRWAQGTIQVFVKDNPLVKKGLSLPQKLMYFSTIFSYFSGFSTLVFIAAPIVYFFTGISPVKAWSWGFFLRFLPFYFMNKFMFRFAARGLSVRRGEQYNMAMFPLYIEAVLGVFLGKRLSFAVTPKTRQEGADLRLVWPQLVTIALCLMAAGYGAAVYLLGRSLDTVGFAVNLFWSLYNVATLSVIVRAVFYKPQRGWSPKPPAFLFPEEKAASADDRKRE